MLEKPTTPQLYDLDFNNWITATVELLQRRDFESLDIENLIEELNSMGNSDKREVFNRLVTIIEHILKLIYWEREREYNKRGWLVTVKTQRNQLRQVLKQSPSLNNYLAENYQECLLEAIDLFEANSTIKVNPEEIEFTLSNVLDKTWVPIHIKD